MRFFVRCPVLAVLACIASAWGTAGGSSPSVMEPEQEPAITALEVTPGVAEPTAQIFFTAGPPSPRTTYQLETSHTAGGPWTEVGDAALINLGADHYEFTLTFDETRPVGFWRVIGLTTSQEPAPVRFPLEVAVVGDRPTSLTAGDLNGDGLTDLATANQGSDDVSILLNMGLAPEGGGGK